jgi:hypothetical protein
MGLLALNVPLPVGHDALAARLIERAGFQAVGVGGSTGWAKRHDNDRHAPDTEATESPPQRASPRLIWDLRPVWAWR